MISFRNVEYMTVLSIIMIKLILVVEYWKLRLICNLKFIIWDFAVRFQNKKRIKLP